MKRILLLIIVTIGFMGATEYRLVNVRKGGRVNVREAPIINTQTLVGTIPADAMGIKIVECKYGKDGKEWCYISCPIGGKHLDGWIRRSFLAPMKENSTSYSYIKNFLKNFYLADEENFLDKLKRFYSFPMQQYFNKRNLNLIQLRTAKVNFYKRWFRRKYQLLSLKILKRTDRYIDVKTTLKYYFSNGYESESGRDTHKIRLIWEGGEFKVLAIKRLNHFTDTSTDGFCEENVTVMMENITQNDIEERPQYYVKVGSFLSNPNPNYLLSISKNGFEYTIQDVMQNGEMIKRVYIGPYPTAGSAKEALREIKAKINKNAYIQSF